MITMNNKTYHKTYQQTDIVDQHPLESEAIYIMREVAGQFNNPVLLFSGGKDSAVLAHLAKKAFYPLKVPFQFLHIDTGHNFVETIEFRDALIKELDVELIVKYVQSNIDSGRVIEEKGKNASRNILQTETLLDVIEEFKIDACIGGARRDEEKARAKERVFSVRNEFGQWDEKNQRPEVFDLLNGKINSGQNVRVFPISNWTELDVWNYILTENLALPSIYFSHKRDTFVRDDLLLSVSEHVYREEHEKIIQRQVRFRTVGDMTCTAALESDASTVSQIIEENLQLRTSERNARIDDKRSDSAMEQRKQQGYF